MRRVACIVLGAALLVAGVQAAAGDVASAGQATPSRLGVRGDEFDLVLSRTRLAPGPALVQFQNAGEDPHDLRMARIGATGELGTGEVPSGAVESFEVGWLKRGSTYRLWCSLPSHVDWGMEANVRVKRRR